MSTEQNPTTEMQAFAKLVDQFFDEKMSDLTQGMSPIAITLAFSDWLMHLASSPGEQLLRAQQAWTFFQAALQNSVHPVASDPSSAETETDPRFKDSTWSQWPYRVLKDNFKTTEKWWHEGSQLDGVSTHHQQLVNFFGQHALYSLSPSNWLLTNPEVMRQGVDSMGMSWLKGLQNYWQDQREAFAHKTHAIPIGENPLPFEPGSDVAVTPGKVVFRNELIELIQYQAQTAQVHKEPLLIVPSCIMKYYILDLSPQNSMVRYLVEQGFTVFIISWRNPDAELRHLGLDDYLLEGVMEALAQVHMQTKAKRVHSMGYCLGGTFLSIVAALMAKGYDYVHPLPELASVSLLAAQTDFTEPGEIGVFIDHDQVKNLRKEMAKKGYLTGKQMAESFRFLNPRDLIWSRSTQRYLLGKDEITNDMMSWNRDVTRLPEHMHGEYLTSLFLNNALAEGHFRVNKTSVALMDIQAPLMIVGTIRDHVSPWRSVYKIHLTTDTDTTFILTSGGHNAGIVSEPGHPHRDYQMKRRVKGDKWIEPEDWFKQAPQYQGSWWTAWSEWLAQQSSSLVQAPKIATQSVLGDAPGEYVLTRYDD